MESERTPLTLFKEFIKLESSAGIILFATAMLAMIINNTPLAYYYDSFFSTKISLSIGQFQLSKPLLLWINDGFMAVFFLLVGLEIKREMFEGELNSVAKSILPAIAAVGGMLVPALIYVCFNSADAQALKGWAIPTATDIAFSLGILSLLGSRIPVSLKIFLTALAIFDDIGAIIVIAIFYTAHISITLLLVALFMVLILFLLNRFKVSRMGAYFIVGIILWICVLKSGIHATLAGIVLAFAIPLKSKSESEKSMLHQLEHQLHPWVAFGILPLFAFANAGVSLSGLTFAHVFSSIPLGIAAGLFIGKQIGVWLFTMLGVRLGIAQLPAGVTSVGVYGAGLLAGVGFTMSLFIGTLAFPSYGPHAAYVRIGVIAGSIFSGVFGYLVLRFFYKQPDAQHS